MPKAGLCVQRVVLICSQFGTDGSGGLTVLGDPVDLEKRQSPAASQGTTFGPCLTSGSVQRRCLSQSNSFTVLQQQMYRTQQHRPAELATFRRSAGTALRSRSCPST
jgi:hypothetical protein